MAPPAEISIPTTSLSTPPHNSKPYTLYNITLRLPLRSFVVQKRYSDFHTLHDSLTSLVGAPPPAPLPAKSWFKSTVSSPELTEDRRLGLERYLRAIAESPDRRWRDTASWRAFLNLPGGSTGTSAASASGVGVGVGGRHNNNNNNKEAATAAAASDPGAWLDLHRELKAALHEARMCLARRDAASEHAARAEAGGAAKRALVRAGALLAGLGEGLRAMREGPAAGLGEGELRRRRDLLAAARVERDGLERLGASLAAAGGGRPAGAGDKAALLGGGGGSSAAAAAGPRAGGRVLGVPLPETERTRELGNEGVVQLQREMMSEQDQDVEALASVVRRQKEMGLAIHDEVSRQIESLDRLDSDTDRLAGKVGVAKNRVRKLG
ncbi:putative snare complex subunit protein [Phialemonium atrogriseum]|uniref:Snare complex subunit protein n=1 Tax=Phialemonium atrogriseum TaxID=1093897 RepID=A0AAJ0BYY1_9PEZI|nr:putative snare complex subunit protein [Phialemonium atrogriseum]KAK1765622.1 putative snare complex subunit protein [Phialemonium atrogriseum]